MLEVGDTSAADRHLDQAAARLEERVRGGAEGPFARLELAAIEAIRGDTTDA